MQYAKFCWYAGLLAVIVYLTGVIVGGLLYPDYSHISQDISQLTSTESPIRNFMNFVFWPYNVLVSIFGLGLYRLGNRISVKIGSFSVILIGILGLLIALFPINTRGTEITATGIIHIAIVSVVSLVTVGSGFLFWHGLKKTKYEKVSRISLISGLGFLISGPVAGFLVKSPYAGLAERIPIGVFLLWILMVSIELLRSEK